MSLSSCPQCWDSPCTCGHMGYSLVYHNNNTSEELVKLRQEVVALKEIISSLVGSIEDKPMRALTVPAWLKEHRKGRQIAVINSYNRQDIKIEGQEIKTVKSLSPCAYCEIMPNEETCKKCTQSGNYSEFSGMEAIFIKETALLGGTDEL